MNKILGRHMFPFLLGIHPGVEFLGHILILCLAFENCSAVSVTTAPLYIPTSNVQKFQFLHMQLSIYFLWFWLAFL